MRVETGHGRPRGDCGTLQFAHLEERDTELRVDTGGPDVLVVAVTATRVDPHEDLPSAEELRPLSEHVQIVHRDPYATFEGPGIFGPRREIRREQQCRRCQPRHAVEGVLDLAL